MIQAPLDLLGRTALQDHKDQLDHQGRMAPQGLWDCQISLELQVRQEPLV